MRVLFFGAGPLGSLYAHRLCKSGVDVTVLSRGERYDWLSKNGLVLVNEMTAEQESSTVRIESTLRPDDAYDLVVVLIRKNKLLPVIEVLAATPSLKNILFMGNNALGFDAYLGELPAQKLLFGFPGAGGGIREQVVHYADREQPKGRQRSVTIGELDGATKERTLMVKSLFESAGVPVYLSTDIDGWLKYHVALISPLVGALYKHNCDNRLAARDNETLQVLVRAVKEGARVLRALGFRRHQHLQFTLFKWLPEFLSRMGVKSLLQSRFAEVAFAMHAEAARDEMRLLASEFEELAARTSVSTSNIDALKKFVD